MTQAQAIAAAQEMRPFLLERGVARVSIELLAGRGGSGWLKETHVGSLGHHTVSRRSNGLTPCLKLVKVGRLDVVGPLCNGYGGFDEVARIICMAWANHPGEGGPTRVEAGTIPKNNGRPYLFGWEFEGGLIESDFTPSYREFMAACLGGTLDYLGRGLPSHLEHKTWAPGRKVDRLGYSLEKARQEISTKFPGEEMSLTDCRIQVASAWFAASGEWMTPQAPESRQTRLTRLAQEVLEKKRTAAQIATNAVRVAPSDPNAAIPAWVTSADIPFA